MVVLNFYGTIPKICISKKLGLYISNLPNEDENDWLTYLANELKYSYKFDKLYKEKIGVNSPCGIKRLYKNLFSDSPLPSSWGKSQFVKIAKKMICISMEYNYDDMPLGGWDTNCFDGRLCEEDYTEKIIDFIYFLSFRENGNHDLSTPFWIYSSNHDKIDRNKIFAGTNDKEKYIAALQKWGEIFDRFLVDRESYLMFDYLVNSIHKDNEYNEYHFVKDFSLCQLFLEKEYESELDYKLPYFIEEDYSDEEKQNLSKLLRQLRNKIAHGSFSEFENKIEEYICIFMDGRFMFDYSELSRKNWGVQSICCLMDDVVGKLIIMLFEDTATLKKIKMMKNPQNT